MFISSWAPSPFKLVFKGEFYAWVCNKFIIHDFWVRKVQIVDVCPLQCKWIAWGYTKIVHYHLSVKVDGYVFIFVVLDNNYWHYFLMLYTWKTSYWFCIFPVSCFIWSTVSFSWPPRFCKRTDYSTGWLHLICPYFKMSKLNYLFEVS